MSMSVLSAPGDLLPASQVALLQRNRHLVVSCFWNLGLPHVGGFSLRLPASLKFSSKNLKGTLFHFFLVRGWGYGNQTKRLPNSSKKVLKSRHSSMKSSKWHLANVPSLCPNGGEERTSQRLHWRSTCAWDLGSVLSKEQRGLGANGDGWCPQGSLGNSPRVCQWELGERCTETEQVNMRPLARFACFYQAFELQAGLSRFWSKRMPRSCLCSHGIFTCRLFWLLASLSHSHSKALWGVDGELACPGLISPFSSAGIWPGWLLSRAPWNPDSMISGVEPWNPSRAKVELFLDTLGPPAPDAPRPPRYQLLPVQEARGQHEESQTLQSFLQCFRRGGIKERKKNSCMTCTSFLGLQLQVPFYCSI